MIALLTAGGAYDDYASNRGWLAVALGILSGLFCVASVLAFAIDSIAAAFGRLLLPLSLLAGVTTSIEAVRDIRRLPVDPALGPRTNRGLNILAILIVALVFAPAIIVGVIMGLKRW